MHLLLRDNDNPGFLLTQSEHRNWGHANHARGLLTSVRSNIKTSQTCREQLGLAKPLVTYNVTTQRNRGEVVKTLVLNAMLNRFNVLPVLKRRRSDGRTGVQILRACIVAAPVIGSVSTYHLA